MKHPSLKECLCHWIPVATRHHELNLHELTWGYMRFIKWNNTTLCVCIHDRGERHLGKLHSSLPVTCMKGGRRKRRRKYTCDSDESPFKRDGSMHKDHYWMSNCKNSYLTVGFFSYFLMLFYIAVFYSEPVLFGTKKKKTRKNQNKTQSSFLCEVGKDRWSQVLFFDMLFHFLWSH